MISFKYTTVALQAVGTQIDKIAMPLFLCMYYFPGTFKCIVPETLERSPTWTMSRESRFLHRDDRSWAIGDCHEKLRNDTPPNVQ